jgi:glycosyltransferase involved in cell wall biosynthesis
MNPKISVITISYNNKEGLEKTLKSVTSQDYKDFEYIVIDGGSNDGSKEILEKYSDKINYWVSEPDKGIYNAMNKGIEAAKGEYLLFLNSGDELFSNTIIAEILPELDGADIISGDLNIVEADGRSWVNRNPEIIRFRVLCQYTILHPCTFIKKECFEKIGYYDEDLKIVADWKWFLLGLGKYNLTYKKIKEIPTVFYADGISSKKENRKQLMEERKTTLEKEFPMFIDDYKELYSNEQDAKILSIMNKSRWTKLGKKIGFMKKAVIAFHQKKTLWE